MVGVLQIDKYSKGPGLTSCRPSRRLGFPCLRYRIRGDDRTSQVPGETPLRTCPALRPRWDGNIRPLRCPHVAFSRLTSWAPTIQSSFGAPSQGLHARCLRFAGWIAPAPRKTRSRWVANPCRNRCIKECLPRRAVCSSSCRRLCRSFRSFR